MPRAGGADGSRLFRLLRLIEAFQGSRQGLTTAELEERLSVSRRTIQRDLRALELEHGVPFLFHGHRRAVLDTYWLRPVAFTPQEAIGLLLSLRLMVRIADKSDAYTASAFEKLAAVLPPETGQAISDTAFALRTKPYDDTYSRVMGVLMGAMVKRQQVEITYERGGGFKRILWPLWLEPSPAGHSFYLLAWNPQRAAPRTYKVERISTARLLEATFAFPRDFSTQDYLGRAWGVWHSPDGIEVELIFRREAATRIKESVWHPKQRRHDLADGSVQLLVEVGHWLELRPWVLSWGAGCEVIRPPGLRESVAAAARGMVTQYGDQLASSVVNLAQDTVASARKSNRRRPSRQLQVG